MKKIFQLSILSFMTLGMLAITSCGGDDDGEEMMENPTLTSLEGDWILDKAAGALAVGPAVGSADWWFNTEEDITARACLFDDVFSFSTDGTFSIDLGSTTWIETWQGRDEEGCDAPVSPHSGGQYTFAVSGMDITLTGSGAYIGLAKAFNGGELSDGASSEPNSRTYTILELVGESPKKLKLDIGVAGEGHWTFNLVER